MGSATPLARLATRLPCEKGSDLFEYRRGSVLHRRVKRIPCSSGSPRGKGSDHTGALRSLYECDLKFIRSFF